MQGLAGTSLGRYHLSRRLGRGGMSEVYLAHDEGMNRDVAIKVVSCTHTDYIERFHREAEAIGGLIHDHILPAYDYGEQYPWHYLVMPYIEYGTLQDRLEQGHISLVEVDRLLAQIASGLQYAHEQGIVHRDIKPSNILLRDENYAYIADFGLAKSLEGGDTVTLTGTLLGTPEYMAPELAEGPATTSSDIYALGILLYQMVTGQLPFSGETPIAVYFKQLRERPMRPSALNPAVPPAIEQVILRTLDKDPRRRYHTAEAVTQAFHRALVTPGSARPEQEALYENAPIEAHEAYNNNRRMQGSPPPDVSYDPHMPLQGGKLVLPGDPAAAPSAVQPGRRGSDPTPGLNRTRNRFQHTPAQGGALDPLTPLPMRRPIESEPEMPAFEQVPVQTPRVRPGPARSGPVRRIRTAPARLRRRLNPITLVALIGVLVLLLISIPFILFYNQASQASHSATATAGGAATATVAANGTLILSDPLASNSSGHWSADGVACAFNSGSYHVYVKQANFLQPCESTGLLVDNFRLQVNVTLLSGDNAGVILRVNGPQFYDFEITSQKQFFFRRHNADNSYTMLIDRTSSSAVAPVGQKNTLMVIAKGNDFKLYINGTFVGEQQDGISPISSGGIGFVAGTLPATSSGEASFANLKIYRG
jgi:serine/threonine protein kinase